MARNARLVEPGTLFHITQRGNNHQEVFLSPSDRAVYLQLAHAHFADCALSLLAYCLMTNHVHWLVSPARPDSMAIFFRRVHGRYAQYLDTRCGLSGHLWQGRFFSCPLEDSHLWAALRYVERNPVRAGLVASPADWEWSSARAHLGLSTTFGCLDRDFWEQAGGAPRWQSLLSEPEPEEWLKRFRRATYAGNPFGSEEFVERARQIRNTTETPLAPAAWIREPNSPCYNFSGKSAL